MRLTEEDYNKMKELIVDDSGRFDYKKGNETLTFIYMIRTECEVDNDYYNGTGYSTITAAEAKIDDVDCFDEYEEADCNFDKSILERMLEEKWLES